MYRRILGQLMYLATITRPDIAYTIWRLSAGISSPTWGLWERMKRLLRYLNGSKSLCIEYEGGVKDLSISIYVDSAFAVDPVRGRSMTGYGLISLTPNPKTHVIYIYLHTDIIMMIAIIAQLGERQTEVYFSYEKSEGHVFDPH